MKVAYLTNQYPHVRHTFIRREIVGIEKHGVEVVRFSVRRAELDLVDPADKSEAEKTNVLLARGKASLLTALLKSALTAPGRFCRGLWTAVRMGWRSDRGLLRHIAYLAEACMLVPQLKAHGAQHLHVHFGTNPAVVALLQKVLGGVPYSLTIHGSEEWDRPEALSLRDKYENATFVVGVSEYGRCQVFRWCGASHWEKVHVVHCGVDEIFLGQQPTPVPDVPRFVAVGALVEAKGHLRLMQALGQLHASGQPFEMILVGDGHLRGPIEQFAKFHNISEKVKIVGWQSNEAVKNFILQSRAMVLPSFAENLPVVFMESLALGRPVIATQLAGIPELIQPGVNGWLVPAGSIDGLTAAFRECLQTPVERLSEMGRAGAARVAEHHNAGREAKRMAELFQRYVVSQREVLS